MFTLARRLLELIRFSHTVFALPFALLAAGMAWRARGTPWRWRELLGIVLAMVFARSVAMAVNRLADRRFDALNPRTRSRYLPAGTLSVSTVAAFALLCGAGFVASAALFWPNPWPLWLSGPVLLFLCGYSLAKRFTSLSHIWLGAALALAPLCAWIALRGPVDLLAPATLGAAVLFWVAGFDIIYACQDIETDRRHGLHSLPAKLGAAGALRLAAALHLATVALLFTLPSVYPPFGWIFLSGVAVVACLLLYEHWLVRPDDLQRVNVAFFQVNAVIGLGLLAVGTADLLW